MTRPRILISEPNAAGEGYAFLPYVWAVLKSYWEHHGSDPNSFEWLDPIFSREAITDDLNRYGSTLPDVLGLSCYSWNWDLQCEIARWAKERNPNCLVVAGGPDPDYKDPDFFSRHPYVDVIVVRDGEMPFSKILDTVLGGGRDFRHVPGLYLPREHNEVRDAKLTAVPHLFTGPAQVPKAFDYSPYLEQSEFYERIAAARGSGRMNATWETNRGCPYGCSFCDWGSATLSKVRRFDMTRVEAEADWLGRMGINFVFLADANFGILGRDIDIADHLANARAKYGYPKFLYYSSAKNNPERTVEIARRTHAAQLTSCHILSVQHTDPEVLAATERSNLPAGKYREVVATLIGLDIPSEVQLIIGIPGDTPDRWRSCLGEIMDWGVHDNYTIFPYSLLPNAPAAEPGFKEKWRMETVDRWWTTPSAGRAKTSLEGYAKSKVVVACRSYSREDWIEMNTYAAFVKAYHNRALTRLPVMYLRFVHGESYRDVYDALIKGFCQEAAPVAQLYRRVRAHYAKFLVDPFASDEMELEDLPGFPFFVDATRWLFVKTCLQFDEFYGALSDYLAGCFPRAKALRSAIEYQKNLVILPDYDWRRGKTFATDHDWPAFGRAARALTSFRPLEEPTRFGSPRIVEVERDSSRRNWLTFDGCSAERWSQWIEQTVRFENSSNFGNFSRVHIAGRCPASAPND